jgi:hypothetical protein
LHRAKHRLKRLGAKRSASMIAFVAVFAVAGVVLLTLGHAANFATSVEAESGTKSGNASAVSDASASGGSAVKFGAASSGGGGTCTNPIGSVQNRDTINIPGNFGGQMSVRNEAWNGNHGPQTTYACSEKSWYTLSNQPNLGGAVETYPDTMFLPSGNKTLSQYNSITSTFGEAYQPVGDWNAAYDLWLVKYNVDIMVWNEWHGSPAFWPQQATTAVTIGGVPYHFYNNGGELMFFRDTQVRSGSVDLLAVYTWLVSQNLISSTDSIAGIDYGVEICSTAGTTERFDTTDFSVTYN